MDVSSFERPNEQLLARLADAGLPRTAIAAMLDRHTPVRYPKGQSLFGSGTPADAVFLVLTGVVKVYASRPGSGRILVELAGPGDIAGHADFPDAQGRRSQLFDAQALTNCSVALFTRHHIVEILQGLEPAVLLKLAEAVNSMWASVVYRYAIFLGMSLRQRLEVVLGEMASRFGSRDARGMLVTPGLAQDELAEMIGSSRPMVSKLLMEMTAEGILMREGRRRIVITPHGAGYLPARMLRQASAEAGRANAQR
ncbi:MAG: Crp/Fnr family transcriptional regulator [Candidatus Binataceae bacterium]